MSDLIATVAPRDAASIGEPWSGTRADSGRRGRTLRRVAVAGSLGAGAWLAMMAVGQSHASAAPTPPVAGVLGTTASVVQKVEPLAHAVAQKPATVPAPRAHIVAEATRTAVATTRRGPVKTVAAMTAPVGQTAPVVRTVVRVVTPAGATVRRTARITSLPVVQPVAKRVGKTVGAVTATVRRVTAPVLAPVVNVISPIVTPVIAPVIAPVVTVIDPVSAPITGQLAPVTVPTTAVLPTPTEVASAAHAVAVAAASKGSARNGIAIGAASTSVSSTGPARVYDASTSPGRHVCRTASVTHFGVHRNAASGGGRPSGPAPLPVPVSGSTSSAGPHSHDSGPSLAGRNARLARPVSASAARLGSDRLPGAPIRFTDVSPD